MVAARARGTPAERRGPRRACRRGSARQAIDGTALSRLDRAAAVPGRAGGAAWRRRSAPSACRGSAEAWFTSGLRAAARARPPAAPRRRGARCCPAVDPRSRPESTLALFDPRARRPPRPRHDRGHQRDRGHNRNQDGLPGRTWTSPFSPSPWAKRSVRGLSPSLRHGHTIAQSPRGRRGNFVPGYLDICSITVTTRTPRATGS